MIIKKKGKNKMKEQIYLTIKNDRMNLLKTFIHHNQNKKIISENIQICAMSETVLDLVSKKLYYLDTPYQTHVEAIECELKEDD